MPLNVLDLFLRYTMKVNFTFLALLLVFTTTAQNLTGIWRGYFVQKPMTFMNERFNYDSNEEKYKFEVQIAQNEQGGIQAVTYSYKTTVFYGKASAYGKYTTKTNNLILKESKMMDLKIAQNSSPCLMTCYLQFSKMGKLEILSGTYSSENLNDASDCGNGRVYLERVEESEFKKESFLNTKPKTATNSKPTISKNAGTPNNRTNFEAHQILIDCRDVVLEFTDYGKIDNDTISIYKDGKPVLLHQRLSDQPFFVKIKIEENEPNELIIVADNLGEIAPNAATMVVICGNNRKEYKIISDESKNAKITFKLSRSKTDFKK